MIKKVTECSEVIIGKFYLVPHVEIEQSRKRRYGMDFVPVLLPYHEDKNLGVAEYHYHHDLRFIPKRLFENNMVTNTQNYFQSLILNETIIKSEKIFWLKKKCLCEHLSFNGKLISKTLEPLYEDAIAVNKICPHKGISLVGCHTKDGIMNCPGHGLQWCEKTGKLHKQSKEKRLDFNDYLAATQEN
jgi:hypothetical protein